MAGLRLLACFAHPDDEAFPVGGSLAAHAQRGVEIRLITTTSGEEGEIRQTGAAEPHTLGSVRRAELACSVETLGLVSHEVLGYRDSGMAGTSANAHAQAYVNAPAAEVVERLVSEIRRFRPQVVLTFEPGGLYGHPDHITICQHTTEAFRLAADPGAFPEQLTDGVRVHAPQRLFYSARPVGFRTDMALKLRAAGVDFPLPSEERARQGVPLEEIHLAMDVTRQVETKMACMLCHNTQTAPDWPYNKIPLEVSASVLGWEHFIRAWPQVGPGEEVAPDFFEGISPDPQD